MLAAASIMPRLMNCVRESTRPLTVWVEGQINRGTGAYGNIIIILLASLWLVWHGSDKCVGKPNIYKRFFQVHMQ